MNFSGDTLKGDRTLRSALWTLSGLRLVCRCGLQQSCHADALISALSDEIPDAFDRNNASPVAPPTSMQLGYLAELREEQDSSEGSSADEDAKPPGAGWNRETDASRRRIHSPRSLGWPDPGVAGSPASLDEAIPSVRRLEGSCGAGQKVLRTFRDNGSS